MRFACGRCHLELEIKAIGVNAEEMTDLGSYRLDSADVLECPECHCKIISNFSKPLAVRGQHAYEQVRENLRHNGKPWHRVWFSKRDKENFAV